MSEPTCRIHHIQMEFFGYIPAPGSDMPGEDWRCSACENSLRRKLENSPKDHWLMIEGSNAAQHLMSGITRAGIRQDGLLRAMYEDGEERETACPDRILDAPSESFTLLAVASALTQEDAPEEPRSLCGDSPSYRSQMNDAGRGHLLR